ncbi:MAG: hypothetical protein AAGA27_02410 [Pseudomonadota bacterium]
MPANNHRIKVTIEPQLNDQIVFLAEHENKSVSKLIKELVIEALEKREDICLSELAEKRDRKGQITVSHVNAWR